MEVDRLQKQGPLASIGTPPHPRYEKLQRWDDALRAYRLKLEAAPPGSVAHIDALLGQCRCLAALAEWDKLFGVCRGEWQRVEPHVRREMAPIAAHAAWQLGDWGAMRQYVDVVRRGEGFWGVDKCPDGISWTTDNQLQAPLHASPLSTAQQSFLAPHCVQQVAHGAAGGGAEGAFLSAVIAIKNADYSAAAGGWLVIWLGVGLQGCVGSVHCHRWTCSHACFPC